MESHNVLIEDAFTTTQEAKEEMINEIRREFYAEGHMFYTYKRLGTKQMMWGTNTMGEKEYIWPLPDSEFDPVNLK